MSKYTARQPHIQTQMSWAVTAGKEHIGVKKMIKVHIYMSFKYVCNQCTYARCGIHENVLPNYESHALYSHKIHIHNFRFYALINESLVLNINIGSSYTGHHKARLVLLMLT